jgi:hypothetical protein
MKRIILTIFVLGALASCVYAQQAEGEDATLYGTCPDPVVACRLFHGPNIIATAWCAFEDCFEMSYGSEARVVAADEWGDFPKMFFVWHEGTMTPGGIPCILKERGHKTRVEIPETEIRCSAKLETIEHLYYEHFVSNPKSGCLAWLECKATE